MRKGKKKCGNCWNFLKMKNNDYSLCLHFDCRRNSGDSGTHCTYYDRMRTYKKERNKYEQ